MAHTFTKNHLHVVFSTKERLKLIAEDFQPQLWKYLTGVCQNIDLIPVAIGGMENHAHMLFHLPPSQSLADAMRVIKTNSSKWINEHQSGFAWQDGYRPLWGEQIKSCSRGEVYSLAKAASSQDEF